MHRGTARAALLAAAATIGLAGNADAALLHGNLGVAHGSAKSVAAKALARYAGRLGVDASQFRFTSVRHSQIGTHVRGFQVVDGERVEGGNAIVSIIGGRVAWVQADQVETNARPASNPISMRAAKASALAALGVSLPTKVHADRLLTRAGDVYRVAVLSLHPAIARTVDVSAATGRVVATRDDNHYDNAVGTVFDPNPIVTSRNIALREPGVDVNVVAGQVDTDIDSAELDAQLKDRAVRDYDPALAATGKLSGPWVNAQGPQPFAAVNGRFDSNRGLPGFETLMAYVHIDRYQRYLQDTLGFKDVNAESQDVIAMPIQGFDNSLYNPGTDTIVMGAGGVDDGEDAEVFMHEYGHAVQDAQVPGWSNSGEQGAMGEGFGDFQAGNYYAKTSGGFQDVCLMEWDSTSYSKATPTCIRRMDSPKKYPKDVENEVHADGEMWATFLWNVRSHLGTTTDEKSDNAFRLVLNAHELLKVGAKFRDAVVALKTAAKALGHTDDWVPAIVAEAKAIGFATA